EQDLIRCGKFGQPERNSDPHIGAVVNSFAQRKADVTLANPIGLCIAGLSILSWETPDGSSALDYWTITRGTPEKALRAVYEVPQARGFTVSDIKINGKKIQFGAQIADFITIKLTGLATRIGQSNIQPETSCATPIPSPAAAVQPVAAILSAAPRRASRY
ncbi:MAG: hypothetical protein WB992_24005, partial [Bryobacteraceae bacterium]